MSRRHLVQLYVAVTALTLLHSNAYHLSDSSEGHVCTIAYGFEPNYDDSEECSTYWSCEDHWAELQYCSGTDQFHFQYGICMSDEDVSCWIQMEKYYHGISQNELQDSEYLTTKTCDISDGQEPNVYDEGCKSYWYCEGHQGTLHVCPDGFQFDWGKLDCLWDEEVVCERHMEMFYEYGLYQTLHEEEEDWSHFEADDDYDVTPSIQRIPSFDSGSSLRRHRCNVERGLEADESSPTCQTFWNCLGYMGTLEKCPEGHLFHWTKRECLREVDVDCVRQRGVTQSGRMQLHPLKSARHLERFSSVSPHP